MAELAVNRLCPLRRTSPVWAAALAPLLWASAGQAAEQPSTPLGGSCKASLWGASLALRGTT